MTFEIDPGLVKVKNELFSLRRILWLLESASKSITYRSERVMLELVVRLIRIQHQWITELKARVEFLERDALAADKQHRSELEAYGLLKQRHAELQERYDKIMQRSR